MQGSTGKCNGKVHTRLVIFQRCGIMANFYVFFCCHFFILKNKLFVALAAVAQWVGHQPAYQRVASSIPSQGTCLGCGPGSLLCVRKRLSVNVCFTHPMFLSLSSSLPSHLSKNKEIKSLKLRNRSWLLIFVR